jgi:hypothetical protein
MIRLGDLVDAFEDIAGGPADDCGISAGTPTDGVHRALFAVDVDAGILMAARECGFDTTIVHHSVGRHYYGAYRRVAHRAHRLACLGFSTDDAVHDAIAQEQQATRRALGNDNRLTVVALAERLEIGCVSAHSVADALFERKVDALTTSGTVDALLAGLHRHASRVPLFPIDEAVTVIVEPGDRQFHRPFTDLASVSPPSPPLVEAVLDQGCDLVVTTAVNPTIAQLCTTHGAGLVAVNHIVFDVIAMDLLASELRLRFPELDLEVAETGTRLLDALTTDSTQGMP